jgi:hypothetical protein
MKKLVSKKSLFLVVSIVVLQIQLSFGQQNYVAFSAADKSNSFSDSFDNNTNKWITDNTWISATFANGHYDITCKTNQPSAGLSFKVVPFPQGNDFEIETSIKVIKGVGAVAFGATEKYDHYRVELSDNNSLEILKDTPSKKKKVEKLFSGSTNTNLLKNSYNKITIRSVKGVFYVFANESLVAQLNNIKPEDSQVGFSVGTNSEISVDYLTVSLLKSPAQNQVQPLVAVNNAPQQRDAVVDTPAAPAIDLNSGTGPKVTWVSPSAQKVSIESFDANVRASIKSGSGIKSVLLYLNGVSKGETVVKPAVGEEGTFIVEKSITFGPGENTIYLVATNSEGATKSESRYFSNPSATAPEILWSSPTSLNSIVGSESITIEATVNSPTELKSLKLIVNGETQLEDNVFQSSGSDKSKYIWKPSVILKKGDNSIYISASNIAATKRSDQRVIKYEATLAEKRIALIIGNSVYANNSVLKNPVNDANLMESTLKELGFEVIKKINAKKTEMDAAVREFSEKLPSYNVALFYYAGHGIQVEGKNYMIPTDAKLEKPSDCKFETIRVDYLVEEFERYPQNTNIVILDACRNNPYASWSRGGAEGYKTMSFTSGTIIAYATSEGKTAADGKGDNGLYTEELVKQMMIPQSVSNVFMKTRVEVKKISGGQQIPLEQNQLDGDFFFKK